MSSSDPRTLVLNRGAAVRLHQILNETPIKEIGLNYRMGKFVDEHLSNIPLEAPIADQHSRC